MVPLPCKNNWDFAYVNGFSVFAKVLDMVTLMLQVFVGEEITLWDLNPECLDRII